MMQISLIFWYLGQGWQLQKFETKANSAQLEGAAETGLVKKFKPDLQYFIW